MLANWKNRVQNYTEVPPQGTWDNIAQLLDADVSENNNWIERISTYEEVPPQGTWDNIAQLLDAKVNENQNWIERISHYEQEPPVFVWHNIESAINNNETKVVAITKNRGFYKLAAAAVFTGVIATGIWLVNQNNQTIEKQNITKVPTEKIDKADTQKTEIAENKSTKNTSETQEINEALSKSKNQPVPKIKPTIKNTEVNYDDVALAKDPFENDNEKIVSSNGQTNNDVDLVATPNSYVTVAGPNGQLVKVSSKFSKLLGLVNDGKADKEKLDVIIDQSKFWSTKFKQWREKMLRNNISTSPDNFMDVLELMKVVEEK